MALTLKRCADRRPAWAARRSRANWGSSMPELMLWNGRGWSCRNPVDPRWNGLRPDTVHTYICATSRADARRVVAAYTGSDSLSDHEIKVYFAKGWGTAMHGIPPSRGLWLRFLPHDAPIKVWGDGVDPIAMAAAARPAPAPPSAVRQRLPQRSAQGALRYTVGDARRLFVLLALLDAHGPMTVAGLAAGSQLDGRAVSNGLAILRTQYGVQIDATGARLKLQDIGPVLRLAGLRPYLPDTASATPAAA
ncbi:MULTISPECIES: hypothetical protein [Cupriavidus]